MSDHPPEEDLRARLDEAQRANRALQSELARLRQAGGPSRTEAHLLESLANVHLLVVQLDAVGRIAFCNDFLLKLTGWTREDLLGQDCFERLLAPEDRAALIELFSRTVGGNLVLAHSESRIITRAGERRVIRWSNTIQHDAQGQLMGTTSIGEDITERLRAEADLRRQRVLTSTILDQLPINVFLKDGEGRFVFANRSAAVFLDRTPEQLVGGSDRDFLPPDQAAALQRDDQAVLRAGQPLVHEEHLVRRGEPHVLDATKVPIRLEGSDQPLILGFSVDITERRRLEEQLRQAQKMDAVGRLAGGIAHDFNNLLTAIVGHGDFLLGSLGTGDPRREDVEEIQRAAERAAGLTRQLLALGRKQVLRPRVLDLNGVVGDLQRMLRRVLGEDVTLATVLAPDLVHVRADPGQLEQVILNLAVNARDAMPQGGRLTIQTANVALRKDVAHPVAATGEATHVALSVVDTGTGMDAEMVSRLFEPFFTTKDRGKGTGLGLATVHGIVSQSGGTVAVDSAVGRGTSFRIYLPATTAPLEPVVASVEPSLRLTGSETVLLVEDEDAVRELAARALRARGYTVLVAADGPAALDLAAQHAGGIDLLLTDVVMPRMRGPDLAGRLLAQRPGLKVLYISGYTDDALGKHYPMSPAEAFLQKPFTPGTLARKVRQVLGGS